MKGDGFDVPRVVLMVETNENAVQRGGKSAGHPLKNKTEKPDQTKRDQA